MKLSLSKIIFIILILVITVALLAAFVIMNHSANTLSEKEKEQALTQILGRPVVLNGKTIPSGNITFKGKYYTFAYPQIAKEYTPQSQQNSSLEHFSFDLSDAHIYVVTQANLAPSAQATLNDNTGVRLRLVQADLYQQATVSADSQTGLTFETTDTNGFAKTAFFLVNGKYYSFSLQGQDKRTIEDLFTKMMLSLKFL